jgi:prepilin-type N-terminal cleavage/methylation domain-containing protein
MKNLLKTSKIQAGFTLLELFAVVALMLVVASISSWATAKLLEKNQNTNSAVQAVNCPQQDSTKSQLNTQSLSVEAGSSSEEAKTENSGSKKLGAEVCAQAKKFVDGSPYNCASGSRVIFLDSLFECASCHCTYPNIPAGHNPQTYGWKSQGSCK